MAKVNPSSRDRSGKPAKGRLVHGRGLATDSPAAAQEKNKQFTNSNQMLKVEDAVATTIGAGDFKNGSTAATEYTYTADGSMRQDLNKGISTITYNILNKPQVVTYSGTPTKTVTYTYDASGVKIKAVTLANSVTTTTDYIGGFVYTNNVLSFFSSPEGRVVKNGANYEYQYAIADHQGNTRVLFTSAAPAAQPVTADFEAATNGSFQNYVNRSGFALFNRTAGGTTSQLLNGGVNGRVGLAKTYRIYAGDKVKIEAYGKYTNATSTGSNLSGFASALLAAYSLPVPAGGETGTPSAALNTWGGLVAGGSGGSGTVKAFVNIIVFDKNYKLIDFMWDPIDANANQVGATPIIAHDYMMREYTAKEESIVYMYVSNESPTLVDVYFDDVTMTYTPGNILQYNEYYPFGLSTANSWTRENTTGNNFLYNGGTELNTTTQVYDLHYRNYDPVLGRMNQVDPVASKYGSVTPYNYAFNAPTNMNDPLGDDPGSSASCSWCNPKPRPTDTGSGGGGGGGGGGNPYASLMGRSAGFFEPGWQPGSGSLSAGAFASQDARYNAYQIQSGNVNGLREGTYTNNGNGGFSYSAFSGSFVPGIASLSQTDKNRIANAATYGRVSYINGTLNITTIAISETGAGEETDYSYYLGSQSTDIQQAGLGMDVPLWMLSASAYSYGIYEEARAAQIARFTKDYLKEWKQIRGFSSRFMKARQATLATNIVNNLSMLDGIKLTSRRMIGVGVVLGIADMANNDFSAESVGWFAADTIMTGIGLTGWGAPVAGVYFAGRFLYGLYDMANKDGH